MSPGPERWDYISASATHQCSEYSAAAYDDEDSRISKTRSRESSNLGDQKTSDEGWVLESAPMQNKYRSDEGVSADNTNIDTDVGYDEHDGHAEHEQAEEVYDGHAEHEQAEEEYDGHAEHDKHDEHERARLADHHHELDEQPDNPTPSSTSSSCSAACPFKKILLVVGLVIGAAAVAVALLVFVGNGRTTSKSSGSTVNPSCPGSGLGGLVVDPGIVGSNGSAAGPRASGAPPDAKSPATPGRGGGGAAGGGGVAGSSPGAAPQQGGGGASPDFLARPPGGGAGGGGVGGGGGAPSQKRQPPTPPPPPEGPSGGGGGGCLFCRIARGEAPGEKILRTSHALVIRDRLDVAKNGHLLVNPLACTPNHTYTEFLVYHLHDVGVLVAAEQLLNKHAYATSALLEAAVKTVKFGFHTTNSQSHMHMHVGLPDYVATATDQGKWGNGPGTLNWESVQKVAADRGWGDLKHDDFINQIVDKVFAREDRKQILNRIVDWRKAGP